MEDVDGTNADKTYLDSQGTTNYPKASDTPKTIKSEKASNPTVFQGHGKTPSDPITEDEMDLLKPSHH